MEAQEDASGCLVEFSVREPGFVDQSPPTPLVCFPSPRDIVAHENACDCASAGFCATTKEVMLAASFEIEEGLINSAWTPSTKVTKLLFEWRAHSIPLSLRVR